MIVEPYTRPPKPRELALLVDHDRVLAEDGGTRSLRTLDRKLQVWCGQDRVLDLMREGHGKAICWRGQPIRYQPNPRAGYRVQVLGLTVPDEDDRALAGLVGWRDWLAGEGAAPLGSLGSSAKSLLRATLERTLWTTAPAAQSPPIRWTVGGRQQLGPAGAPLERVGTIRHYDLRAAYAQTLSELRYGGHWHRMRTDERRLHLFAVAHPLFVRARVRLPGGFPGPLVKRERKDHSAMLAHFPAYPTRGRLQGIWTWEEVEQARAMGAGVTILDAWGHASAGWRPFLPWWEAVERGRNGLHGFASTLAKATGNALWGQFCIQPGGKRSILFYERRGSRVVRRVELLDGHSGPRPAHDLSELLTGLVRARLQAFMRAAGERLCSAHTDGGWTDCTDGWAYREEGWRLKETATRIRVLDPQMLAYRIGRQESYVVAGWPARLAGGQFEATWEQKGPDSPARSGGAGA